MSVYSMTGYATAHSGADGLPEGLPGLGIEMRSVNGRFLDLVMKLPEELRAAEPALRELLAGRLRRGKVEVRAWIEGRTDASQRAPGVAELQRLAALQDLVRGWLPQAAPLSVAEVMQLTGRPATDPGRLQAPLMHLAGIALDNLLDARRREGRRLADMLLDRVAQLRQLAADAQPLIPRLVEQQRQRFLDRWNEALGADTQGAVPGEAARERALSEATAFAIRIDVAEELTRIDAHLEEIERLLGRGAELGKRLDFLIQELHREANTLGSKSSSLELTRISVDMKVLIEQMREQVQNIE
ncbi:MAG: YicC family protein [Burkholderiales bacterium]|nr:MAG: YicC family protein [Burkholderiales bacterium]